jgi:hypothetical protein
MRITTALSCLLLLAAQTVASPNLSLCVIVNVSEASDIHESRSYLRSDGLHQTTVPAPPSNSQAEHKQAAPHFTSCARSELEHDGLIFVLWFQRA